MMAIEQPVVTNTITPCDSFKDKLLNKSCSINKDYSYKMGKHPFGTTDNDDTVNLSDEDKMRIYRPWQYSVIVNLFNKQLAHNYLKTKSTDIWKPTKPLTLIDLWNDFYTAKFNKPKNMTKALHDGPWFVTGHFLSVRQWKPNFALQEATQTHTEVWIRLLQLPTEFYDKTVLERIGSKWGVLLKINTCTSSTLRGRYARICIQVPLETPP